MSPRAAALFTALVALLDPVSAMATVPPASPRPAVLPDTTQPAPPQRSYRHLWTDDKGISHITTCPVHDFFLKSMSPPAGPQWQDPMAPQVATVMVTVQPARWNGTWHPDPRPQWIVPLQGRWYVRAMDGTRVEMGPGDILFGEDQGVRPMQTGPYRGKKGHDAGNIGSGPVTLMVIQSANEPVINQPCRYH